MSWSTFSPDGSRLVGTTNEPPSAQVIDLRPIRRRLAEMGLDWDAPAFPEDDPARPDLPPLPPLKVDYGFLTPHLEHFSERPEPLVERYTERIKQNPDDSDAYHHRAHALSQLNRPAEAIDDLSRAIRLQPDDAHLLHLRAQLYARVLKKLEPAIADLEAALSSTRRGRSVRELLAECCNNLAWLLAANPPSNPDLDRALKLSLRAVELAPGQQMYLNTRGVVLYRAGQFAEAVTTLEKSLEAGQGQFDGFDLFFLAMAHHRLGHARKRVAASTARSNGWAVSARCRPSTPRSWRHSAPRPSPSWPGRRGNCPTMSSIGRDRNTSLFCRVLGWCLRRGKAGRMPAVPVSYRLRFRGAPGQLAQSSADDHSSSHCEPIPMPDQPAICVFCGSSPGASSAYREAARQVGETLVRHRVDLVYGGGRVGLMGIVADAVLGAGGRAIGVIPNALATKEIAHDGLTELHVVSGMHERKALMATKSSAFLTLPGGIGTFEEFFEILSWARSGSTRSRSASSTSTATSTR